MKEGFERLKILRMPLQLLQSTCGTSEVEHNFNVFIYNVIAFPFKAFIFASEVVRNL